MSTAKNTPVKTENTSVYSSFKKIARELYLKNFELYKERKRLHEILSQVGEVIFAVDEKYKLTVFNTTAATLFKVSEKDAVGKDADSIIKLILDNKKQERFSVRDFCFKENIESAFLEKNEEKPIPLILKTPDGEEDIYLKISFTNIELSGEKKSKECVVAMSNITNEVAIDKQKDEFISIASHELKTPITIIKTNFWMFKYLTKEAVTKEALKYVKEMDYGIARLSKIVSNLLDISRIEQGKFILEKVLFDADTLLKECLDNFTELAKQKNLKLIYPTEKVGEIFSDKERIREVLDNFISNAIKYTEIGGVSVNIKKEEGYYRVLVTDTGPGIDEHDKTRLFKKFSRAKEGFKQEKPGASTGLGLYISKRIVEEMGGNVGVNSTIGKGSVFWFTFPIEQVNSKA